MEGNASEARTSVAGAELRLLPEFGVSGSLDVVEWLDKDKAELVCDLRGISKPETVIPLRLNGGAFAVYHQLTSADKKDFEKIKCALCTAFAADSFLAYEHLFPENCSPERRWMCSWHFFWHSYGKKQIFLQS